MIIFLSNHLPCVKVAGLCFSELLKQTVFFPSLPHIVQVLLTVNLLARNELFPDPSLSQIALIHFLDNFSSQAAELAIKFLGQSQSMEVTRTVAPQLVAMKKYSSVRAGTGS